MSSADLTESQANLLANYVDVRINRLVKENKTLRRRIAALEAELAAAHKRIEYLKGKS